MRLSSNLLRTTLHSLCTNASSSIAPRLAVVGAGPAGFSFTSAILRLLPNTRIDLIDKLPVPFGLIRYGVAPDHPEVKNVIHEYERLVDKHNKQISFYGNVSVCEDGVGGDVTMDELLQLYDAVVITNGAESEKWLDIPGIHSPNSFSARRFVGWYNGLPRDKDLQPSFSGNRAVIIGHGNVALDIARILLLPISILQKTDIAQHALQLLKKSCIREVVIVGRRGPLQVAFTTKELREMVNLPGSVCHLEANDFIGIDDSLIESLPRPRKRLSQLLLKTVNGEIVKKSVDLQSGRSCKFKFLMSPCKIDQLDQRLRVSFTKNKLEDSVSESSRVIATKDKENIVCDLLVTSIGYKSIPLVGVPFDSDKHVIATVNGNGGRVVDKEHAYACGWCAKGPTGVLVSTQLQAKSCAQIVSEDLLSGSIPLKGNDERSLSDMLNSANVVCWEGWKMIDLSERRGASGDSPRRKLVHLEHILQAASIP